MMEQRKAMPPKEYVPPIKAANLPDGTPLAQLTDEPIYIDSLPQKFNCTWQRRFGELRELLGYGVDQPMMNDTKEYWLRLPAQQDSVWGKQLLRLQNCCWLDPKAYVEHVPAHWKTIEVALYHSLSQDSQLQGTTLQVKVAPMSNIDNFEEVFSTDFSEFSLQSDCPENQIHRQLITSVDIPSHISEKGAYAVQVVVFAADGSWKSGWTFEGIGVTQWK